MALKHILVSDNVSYGNRETIVIVKARSSLCVGENEVRGFQETGRIKTDQLLKQQRQDI